MRKVSSSPYVGPEPFTLKSRYLFQGREREALVLRNRLISQRLTLLHARSGAGKTSLINARLIEDLHIRGFDVLPTARVGGTGKLDHNSDIANVFVADLISSMLESQSIGPTIEDLTIAQFLTDFVRDTADRDPACSIDEAAKYNFREGYDKKANSYEDAPRVLVVDQFEEIFTSYHKHWSHRRSFFEQLGEALIRDPQLWVLLSMRGDYVDLVSDYAQYFPNRLQARYHLLPLSDEDSRKAIQEPPRVFHELNETAANLEISNEAATNLVEMLHYGGNQEYVEPVVLQLVCENMWRESQAKNIERIDAENLKEIVGDLESVIQVHYEEKVDEAIKSSKADGRNLCEADLRSWFEEDLISAGNRQPVTIVDGKTHGTYKIDEVVVSNLEDAHILRSEPHGEIRLFELSHDRFVGPIIQANRLWRIERPELRIADRWKNEQTEEKKKELLYKGRELKKLRQRYSDPADISSTLADFIEASETGQSVWRKQRRLKQTIFVLIPVFILASLLLIYQILSDESQYDGLMASALQEQADTLTNRTVTFSPETASLLIIKAIEKHGAGDDSNNPESEPEESEPERLLRNSLRFLPPYTVPKESGEGLISEACDRLVTHLPLVEGASMRFAIRDIQWVLRWISQDEFARSVAYKNGAEQFHFDRVCSDLPFHHSVLRLLADSKSEDKYSEAIKHELSLLSKQLSGDRASDFQSVAAEIVRIGWDQEWQKLNPAEGARNNPEVTSILKIIDSKGFGNVKSDIESQRIQLLTALSLVTAGDQLPADQLELFSGELEIPASTWLTIAARNRFARVGSLPDENGARDEDSLASISISDEDQKALQWLRQNTEVDFKTESDAAWAFPAVLACVRSHKSDEETNPGCEKIPELLKMVDQNYLEIVCRGDALWYEEIHLPELCRAFSPAPPPKRLANPGLVTGMIGLGTTEAWYVEATENQVLRFTLFPSNQNSQSTPSLDQVPILELSGGISLTHTLLPETGGAIMETVLVTRTGLLTVTVRQSPLAGLGAYVLTVANYEPVTLEDGDVITASTTHASVFQIEMDEMQGGRFAMHALDSSFAPVIRKVSPDRTIKSESGVVNLSLAEIVHLALESGVLLLAPSSKSSNSGWYQLEIATRDQQELTSSANPVVTGTVPSDFAWVLSAKSGDVLQIDMKATGSGLDPYLRLVGPNGFEQVDDDGGNGFNARITHSVPATGNYLIYPEGLGGSRGRYQLEIQSPSSYLTVTADMATVVTGTVPSDLPWVLSAEAGDVLRIDMKADGSSLDPYLRLVGPNGFEKVDDDSGNGLNARVTLSVPETGNYLIYPGGLGGSRGPYQLEIQSLTDELSTSSYLTVTADMATVVTGTVPSDLPWVLSAEAGDVLQIDMKSVEAGLDPYLRLFSPDGFDFTDDDSGDGTNARITILAPQGGNYLVFPESYRRTEKVYRLEIQQVTERRIVSAAEKTVVSGIVSSESHWEVFAEAGDVLQIEMEAIENGPDPYLRLIGPDGFEFEDDSGDGLNARIIFPVSVTGNYSVYPEGRGPYRLEVRSATTESLASSILTVTADTAKVVTGTVPSDLPWVLFAEEGDVLRIDMEADGAGLDPYLRLVGPDGFEEVDDDSGDGTSARIIFPVSVTGNYFVYPENQSGKGHYRLEIQSVTTGLILSPFLTVTADMATVVTGTVPSDLPWVLFAEEGDVLRIDMEADGAGLDPYLRLVGPDGFEEVDDDSGEGTNARITLSAPATGNYRIYADAWDLGPYRLLVTKLSAPSSPSVTSSDQTATENDTKDEKDAEGGSLTFVPSDAAIDPSSDNDWEFRVRGELDQFFWVSECIDRTNDTTTAAPMQPVIVNNLESQIEPIAASRIDSDARSCFLSTFILPGGRSYRMRSPNVEHFEHSKLIAVLGELAQKAQMTAAYPDY